MDTRHPDEGTLHAYVEGQLQAAEQSRVDAHVSGCAECAKLVAEARGLIAAASGIIGALDDVPLNVVPRRTTRRRPTWLAAAAVVVLAAGLSTVVVREKVSPRMDVVATKSGAGMESVQQADLQSTASAVRDTLSAGQVVVSEPVAKPGGSGAASIERKTSRRAAATPPEDTGPQVESDREESPAFTVARGQRAGAPAALAAPAAPVAAVPGRSGEVASGRQEVTITGRVMTERGEPLSSANVFINDLNISVATDTSGAYSMTVPESRLGQVAEVRVRAIGYAPQLQRMVVVPGTQNADFAMRTESMQLSEAVVTGVTTASESRIRERAVADATGARADSISARNAGVRTMQQVESRAPMRTVSYEVSAGTIVELREFDAAVRIPAAERGVNEYRWRDSAGRRQYVLSGRLPVAELEQLARRLGELRVVR